MTASALPITRLINVSVNLAPNAAQIQNIATLLVLGTSKIIDVTERQRSYATLSGVAADFGTTAEEYLSAVLWFEQSPQPVNLMIGRWANTDTAAVLKTGLVAPANLLMGAWTGISAGSFKITINDSLKTITGLNFSAPAVTSMNGVAAIIQTALNAALTGTTCIWDSVYSTFIITSPTAGEGSTITFLTADAGVGTDISSMMSGLSTQFGYVTDGIVAETALAAVTILDNNYGQQWYGMFIPAAVDADHIAVSSFIEGTTNKHTYWISTIESGVISAVSSSDIAYVMKRTNQNRSIVHYSSTNQYAVCSLAAKALTIDYNANNTVIDLMYKQEPGIIAETLNESQITALESKNANVFLAYNNNTAIIEPGNNVGGVPIDIITGTDWLALDIQTAVFNLLYQSPTKIPQTDPGNNMIMATIEAELAQAVTNGLLAPGTWTTGGFGAIKMGDYLPKGFYVYAPPISSQNVADRSARKSVTFQIAAKLAGAIRTVNIIINVNR